MAIAESVRQRARTNPRLVTGALSLLGYALVIGAFAGYNPFPDPGREGVLLLGDLIAVVNTVALLSLLLGVRFIRRGNVRRHRQAMLTSFSLILLFLVVYIWKLAGFTKELVIQDGQFLAAYAGLVTLAYFAMLAVHILLSIVAVPVVVHAVVLGLSHTPEELPDTLHPTVGKLAAASWSLSLALGVITYWLLNHVYAWRVMGA